jgi:putative ABC transport system permease protein
MLIKDTGTGNKGKKLRSLLVIFQFTISIVLIAFTIQINQQVNYMKEKDTGISKEHIIYARLPHQLFLNVKELFTERLEAVPGVQQVSYSSRVFGEINDNGSAEVDGKTLKYIFVWVDAAFIELFDLELMEGRFFSEAFTSDRNATALLNETAVGAFGLDDPLDLKIRVPGGNAQVVGIVKDFNFKSLHHAIEPLAIIYFPGQGIYVNIKCYAQDMPHTIKEIEKIWKELSPEFPFNYQYLETSFNHLYQGDEKIGKAILYASLVAIFIAIMGVLSLSLFLCQSKEKEIAIRKINGAKEWEVIRNLNKAFFYNVLIAFVIACPLAWYIMVQWLENFAYKTSIHLWIFVLSGCIVALISISIVSLQSWRFARQNPADTLRNE